MALPLLPRLGRCGPATAAVRVPNSWWSFAAGVFCTVGNVTYATDGCKPGHSLHSHQMLVGLVSDTHGVYDPALATHFAGADAILHAGDVGSHGGHAAVLARLREVCPAVHAVRGNVDDDAAAQQELPESLLLTLAGWRVLLVHILADAAAAIQRHQPDILVHGHSHKYSVAAPHGSVLLQINPGSAGPARFKLNRTAALLRLPRKDSGDCPQIQRVELAPKAPPRLPEARKPQKRAQPLCGPVSSRRRDTTSAEVHAGECKRVKM